MPAPQAPTITQVLASKGYEGCSLLARQRGRKQLLYVCWKRDNTGTNKPSFFYYDRTRFKLKENAQANQIESMIKDSSSSGDVILQFKEGEPKSLNYSAPFWMKNFQSGGLKPDEQCELKSNSNNKSPYTLSCKDNQKSHMIQEGIHI